MLQGVKPIGYTSRNEEKRGSADWGVGDHQLVMDVRIYLWMIP